MPLDADDRLAEAEGDAEVAQVVLQRLDDLRVAELEQALALLDDRDACVPSAANIDAYSMPITPAPTTTSEGGIWSSSRMPSESSIVRSSNATVVGRAGGCRSRSRSSAP